MEYPESNPPMDPPDPPVARILERASLITQAEAIALDAAVRARPSAQVWAQAVLDEHQRWKNSWAMFDHWPDPYIEMGWARDAVCFALGKTTGSHRALEPDDGTIATGAGTAAAYAVLVVGRAGAPPELRAAWDAVIRD